MPGLATAEFAPEPGRMLLVSPLRASPEAAPARLLSPGMAEADVSPPIMPCTLLRPLTPFEAPAMLVRPAVGRPATGAAKAAPAVKALTARADAAARPPRAICRFFTTYSIPET